MNAPGRPMGDAPGAQREGSRDSAPRGSGRAGARRRERSAAGSRPLDPARIQKLVLTGVGADCCRHLVLEVTDAPAARRFLAGLLRRNWIRHAVRDARDNDPLAGTGARSAVNVGFTYVGLVALELEPLLLEALANKARAYAEGAVPRAAAHLADAGASAAERWEATFAPQRAHVLLTIHADDSGAIAEVVRRLRAVDGSDGLAGWESTNGDPELEGHHLREQGAPFPSVHFGFADGIARPAVEPPVDDRPYQLHEPGELLLGHANDAGYDRWSRDDATAEFFRDGSFGILRKIEQNEEAFREYVQRTADKFRLDPDLVKAKLCGRWPNGAPLAPGQTTQPEPPGLDRIDDFDFTANDPDGFGCPFGAHIRRTNPRGDPVVPKRQRPLFRRGMPYGPKYDDAPKEKRGLLGLFFCASIEDQFEHMLSSWVDRAPMGPRIGRQVKDPLIGAHDDPAAGFHVPQPEGPDLVLGGFDRPFVTTKGTLYAFFPSLPALQRIARPGDAPGRRTPRRAEPAPDSRRTPIAGDTAPKDRFCDIVMEGGVTSGVIYSSLVAELAKHYRFQSIAGTSIGAFAAAVTAAAELRRRHGSIDGFRFIHELPELLAKTRDGGEDTLLRRMFRAEPKTRRLFEIFLATLNRQSALGRIAAAIGAAFAQYRRRIVPAAAATLLVAALGPLLLTALAWPHEAPCCAKVVTVGALGLTLLLALLLALAVAIGTGAASVAIDLVRGLVPNGFGLCRGGPAANDEEDPEEPTLTFAIHLLVQKAAGREAGDAPVTFEDLWKAPGFPPPWLPSGAGAKERSIDLQMYATSLTHGRPFRFPLDEGDDTQRLFFDPRELADYLPKALLGPLVGSSLPYGKRPGSDSDPDLDPDPDPDELPAELRGRLRELPMAKMPIAVAARLSLSFPLLISAVPLWAIDHEPRRGQRTIRRCWFADGGLCVNFPIHLFDSFVPPWPTFGISLQSRAKFRPDQAVWLPRRHFEGRADSWNRSLDEEGASRAARLGAFAMALWNAVWNWNNATATRMPGIRDRVVRVLLRPGEGGVNIRMSAQQIHALAEEYGYPAAVELHAKFLAGNGWDEHRWVRFNALLAALRQRLEGFAEAAELDRHATPLTAQIIAAGKTSPLEDRKPKPISPAQARELRMLLEALRRLEASFVAAGDHRPYEPQPELELRLRPKS